MEWEFEIIRQKDGSWDDSIITELSDLAENGDASHVFFHPSMIDAWVKTYLPLRDMEPFIVKATSESNKALLPMVVWHKNWKNAFQTVIIPVGYSDFDYHNPLFIKTPSKDNLKEFWDGITKTLSKNFSYDEIIVDGITDNFITDEALWRKDEICPSLSLENINSETELMNFFKTSLRGDIRRQIRRLEEVGPLKFKEYSSWEEIPQEIFSEFMKQHSLRWPNAYKAPKFHENMLRDGLKSGVVHFSTLSVGETEIAWHLGFSYKGRYYYYMPAGNKDFFKFSPTKIHLFYLVRRAVENGYKVFDHLRGEENYKSGWSNGAHYVNTMTIEGTRLSSKVKNNLLKLRKTLIY